MNVFKCLESAMMEIGKSLKIKSVGELVSFILFFVLMVSLLVEFFTIIFTGTILVISFK